MANFETFEPAAPVLQRTQQLWAEARRLVEAAPKEAAIFLGVTVGIGVLLDVMGSTSTLPVNIAVLALGFLLVSAMLRNGGLAPEGLRHGFGTYFGISILSGIATIIGLVLLIVPGVLLLVRWSAAFGHALAGGDTATEALGTSWRGTEGHFWPILLALLLPGAMMLAGAALYAFIGFEAGPAETAGFVVANLAMMGASLASTAIGIAVYSLTANAGGGLSGVFE